MELNWNTHDFQTKVTLSNDNMQTDKNEITLEQPNQRNHRILINRYSTDQQRLNLGIYDMIQSVANK